jgi:hypothetical protein
VIQYANVCANLMPIYVQKISQAIEVYRLGLYMC